MKESHVVTCFLRNDAEILLLRRSESAGTFPGRWAGVSGHAEDDPESTALSEIREETGLDGDLVRAGETVRVESDEYDRTFVVHPFLVAVDAREVELNEENDRAEWVHPPEMRRRETVPGLWRAYERVAPTVRTVAADDEHGSASLSARALEVLRDRAGLLATSEANPEAAREELTDLARRLREARPGMAALRNRVDRAVSRAVEADDIAAALEASAVEGIETALRADAAAASNAAADLDGERVLTLSRSGTVRRALDESDPDRVFVAESRPGREGVGVAEELSEAVRVTVLPDAAVAHALATEAVDRVLVGADTVLPDGRVVNKVGTRAAALAAVHEGVPTTVVAARDKITTREEVNLEVGAAGAVYDGPASVDVLNPVFDVTPAEAVTEIVTEEGSLDPDEIRAVTADHRAHAEW